MDTPETRSLARDHSLTGELAVRVVLDGCVVWLLFPSGKLGPNHLGHGEARLFSALGVGEQSDDSDESPFVAFTTKRDVLRNHSASVYGGSKDRGGVARNRVSSDESRRSKGATSFCHTGRRVRPNA